jgi:hypothetical protein
MRFTHGMAPKTSVVPDFLVVNAAPEVDTTHDSDASGLG